MLTAVSSLVVFVSAAPAEGDFEEANHLFERGKHAEAAQAYERLVQTGQGNATVYFNMGTAWLQAGRIGLAVDALIQAHRIAPNDVEIANNLRIARLKSGTSVQDTFVDLLARVPLNAWTWLAGFGTIVWFGIRARVELRPSEPGALRMPLIVVGSITVLFAGGAAAVAWDHVFVKRVVVITPEAVVRRGPVDESAAVFTPSDGVELTVAGEKDEWFKVKDVDGQGGWVLKDQVKVMGSNAGASPAQD